MTRAAPPGPRRSARPPQARGRGPTRPALPAVGDTAPPDRRDVLGHPPQQARTCRSELSADVIPTHVVPSARTRPAGGSTTRQPDDQARLASGARCGSHAVAIVSPRGSSGGWRLRSSTVPRRERDHRAPDPDRIDHRSSWAIVEYVAPDGSVPALEEQASPLRPAGGAAASASLTVGIGARNDARYRTARRGRRR